MEELDPDLRNQLQQTRTKVNLIIRVRAGAGDRGPDLVALGCTIRRRFWLTRSFAVTCSGAKALRIAKLDWVERIEADRTVKTLSKRK